MNTIHEVDRFLGFLDESVAWFKRRADRLHSFYNVSRVALVVLSAALPALTANGWDIAATVTAVIVAAIAGLDAQFKPGDQWRHHRSTQLALLRHKRQYELELARRPDEPDAAFQRLADSVEQLLAAEAEQFWKFRIAPWTEKPRQ